jgi:hypothetical protein
MSLEVHKFGLRGVEELPLQLLLLLLLLLFGLRCSS